MTLTFLGTRGEIEARTRSHRRHASLLIGFRRRRVLIDCGADWAGQLNRIRPHAILLTHAHPDHAFGLRDGAPCPVHATRATWRSLRRFSIADRRIITPRRVQPIETLVVEAFTVEHSLRAPAVGYRITGGRNTIFYVPDVVSIHQPGAALRGVRIFIGDGATMTRPLVRRRDGRLIGHTTVRAQLGWCERHRVPRAFITHCGTGIVTARQRDIVQQLHTLGAARNVHATLAFDGLRVVLR